MNKTISIALIAASLAAFPAAYATPSFAVDNSIQRLCGPDAPESYKRPGGYCESIGATGSLMDSSDCQYQFYISSLETFRAGDVVLVADNCVDHALPA